MFALREAFVFVLEPPSVPGIGTGGGLKGYVQDRAGRGLPALEGATWAVAGAAGQTPGLTQAFTLFNTRRRRSGPTSTAPRPSSSACRSRACSRRCRSTWARRYVNDFNILGRTYRVTAQADNPYRLTLRDVANLKTRNASGEMVPIGSVATFSDTTGPYRVARYNLYPGGRGAGRPAARLLVGAGHRGHRGPAPRRSALGLRLRMDRDRAAGEARRQHRRAGVRPGRGVRVPAAGRALRELAACRSPSS